MNRSLSRAVGRCHGQREERQPGRDSHDRGPWLASQQREQSTRQADRAQQIGGYHRFGVDKVLGRSLQVFWTHNAGVVDNDVERGKFACHLRRHGTDALGVLDVEQDGLHPRIRGGRFFERFAPTAGDHYLIVCLKKRFRQSTSDTRAAASNEDGVAIDVHVFSSFALKVTKMQIAPQIRRPELHGRQPSAVDAAKIKAPLLLHYASLDTRITGRWLAQEEAPKANHMSYTAYVYEGVNHGFHNDMAPRYDEAAHRLKTRLSISITNCGSFGSLLPLGPATLSTLMTLSSRKVFSLCDASGSRIGRRKRSWEFVSSLC